MERRRRRHAPPQTFYFKIPPNDKLLGYWTTVADRLYKLRHCQNIAGVTRSAGPVRRADRSRPADPAQAAGVDIGSVLSDLAAAAAQLPLHRALSAGARLRQRRARVRSAAAVGAREERRRRAGRCSSRPRSSSSCRTATRSSTGRSQQAQNAIDALTSNAGPGAGQATTSQQLADVTSTRAEITGTTLQRPSIVAQLYRHAVGHACGRWRARVPIFIARRGRIRRLARSRQPKAGGNIKSRSAIAAGRRPGVGCERSTRVQRWLPTRSASYSTRKDDWDEGAKEAADRHRQANIAARRRAARAPDRRSRTRPTTRSRSTTSASRSTS